MHHAFLYISLPRENLFLLQLFKRWIALSDVYISIQSITQLVSQINIRWMVIYLVDNAVHRINLHAHKRIEQLVSLIMPIRWVVIYPLDSAFQNLNNPG